MSADNDNLGLAMSMVEVAVQDMAAAGLGPMKIAIGLAFHLCRQVDLAMPNSAAADAWIASLTASSAPPGVVRAALGGRDNGAD